MARGNRMPPVLFIFVLMPAVNAFLRPPLGAALVLVLACGVLPGTGHAQEPLVLDTGVSATGLLQGHLSDAGVRLLRSHLQGGLEHRYFQQDGTPGAQLRYAVPDAFWSGSPVLPTPTGTMVAGTPLAGSWPGAVGASLAVPLLLVAHDGVPVSATRLLIGIGGQPTPATYWTRLLPMPDGGGTLLTGTSGANAEILRVVRLSATGEPLWAASVGAGDVPSPVAWGGEGTLACTDSLGGTVLLRAIPDEQALVLLRMGPTGELDWVRSWSHDTPYALEVYDMALAADGQLLVLGRMAAPGLPSGGFILRLDDDGVPQRMDRYQWDVGTRLIPAPDGGLFTFTRPWLYRLDESGSVQWARYLENWSDGGEFTYVPDMEEVSVEHGVLRMHGALRKVHVQSNTQRIMPMIALHALDGPEGCRVADELGFGFTALGPAWLQARADDGPAVQDIAGALVLVPTQVTVSTLAPLEATPLCELVTSIPDLGTGPSATPLLAHNVLAAGMPLQLRDVPPGHLLLTDTGGRLIWQRGLAAPVEQLSIALPAAAPGLYVLHWRAHDGSAQRAERLLVQ